MSQESKEHTVTEGHSKKILDLAALRINKDDILRVSRLLGLSDLAFFGMDGSDPRADVIQCMESIDVAACPGSGKTTTLVAKLALLADKWVDPTRGICVLSHTNVARQQIETRLGASIGKRLLAYPHFVGTIHGFLNQYLALPWLRSQGFVVSVIDSGYVLDRRWRSLPSGTRHMLTKLRLNSSILTIKSVDCDLGEIPWGRGFLGKDTDTYTTMHKAVLESILNGEFTHDEMFLWAEDMLTKEQWINEVICDRFPLLFIDEAQDNSDLQSSILSRIFHNGDLVIQQRFGDSNQAIYGKAGADDATIDLFPDQRRRRDIPESHRFGQSIADLADPLGVSLYEKGLVGKGPHKSLLLPNVTDSPHTIFLFENAHIKDVLARYAEKLLSIFSDEALREGTFVVAGYIHRAPDEQDPNKMPQYLGDYWEDYVADSTPPRFEIESLHGLYIFRA